MEPKKRQALLGGLALAGVLGLVFMGVYGGRVAWGGDVGEKCNSAFGCVPQSVCISNTCRRACKVDGDCQPEWMCRGTSVSVTPGGNASKGYKIKTVKICFSPEQMAPQLAQEAAAQLKKKKEKVVLQVIVNLTTRPPQLADGEFDAAWATIPEAEQTSASVGALAAKVVALTRPGK